MSSKAPRRPTHALEGARSFEQDLARAAAADVTVLIEGEHGAGKSSAAHRLHAASRRAAGPLVVADLAALAPNLLEAELFGHVEGAFTGASEARQGRFRRASGGTIVLEGVENLPAELQVKLLRVLQERSVEPLGGEASHPVDVRVVATSALPLEAEVAAGRFRQDLYWRLAVVVLHVPPLRARVAELPSLVAELAPAAAARAGVAPRPIGADALARLARHAWPGNVRELENALERALVLGAVDAAGGELTAADFAFLEESTAGAAQRIARDVLAHGLTLEELCDAMLDEALREQRGNHTAAARRLGLSRRAFEYRRSRRRGGASAGEGDAQDEGGANGEATEGPAGGEDVAC